MLEIPNHERLQTISDILKGDLEMLDAKGVPYYDPRAEKCAAFAIKTCMPHLGNLSGERVEVEGLQGISLDAQDVASYENIHVGGVFRSVHIQKIIETAGFEDREFSFSSFDLCAVIVPDYKDPEPTDIIFGKELYVPFSMITKFETAA